MNKEEFYAMVEEKILEYLPEEYKDHTLRLDEVNKSGDVRLHGLSLIKGNNGTAPILYLEPFFEMHQMGWPAEELLQKIAEKYNEIVKNVPEINIPDMAFESIKDNLRVRLVYNRTNYNYLAEHVYKDVGCGYCLVVYADLSDKLFDGAVINIRKDMLNKFDLNEGELIKSAMEGSVKNCPARLTYLSDEMDAMMHGTSSEDILKTEKRMPSKGPMVLTTEDRFGGAATLFYPGVADHIAKILDWDYFILPSSVHEMIIIPSDGTVSAKELALMVKTVNANEVSKEEQLGNRVLFYDREEKDLSVIWDLDRKKNREEAR